MFGVMLYYNISLSRFSENTKINLTVNYGYGKSKKLNLLSINFISNMLIYVV